MEVNKARSMQQHLRSFLNTSLHICVPFVLPYPGAPGERCPQNLQYLNSKQPLSQRPTSVFFPDFKAPTGVRHRPTDRPSRLELLHANHWQPVGNREEAALRVCLHERKAAKTEGGKSRKYGFNKMQHCLNVLPNNQWLEA